MKKYFIQIVQTLLLLTCSVSWANKKETETAPVKVESLDVLLDFTYANFQPKVKVYEYAPKIGALPGQWTVVKKKSDMPIGNEITTKKHKFRKGAVKQIVFAVENETDKDLYFYASPHDTAPPEHSLGNKLTCFCYGVVYKVPAKSIWYRIGHVTVETASIGNEIVFRHKIIGITPEQVRQHLESARKLEE